MEAVVGGTLISFECRCRVVGSHSQQTEYGVSYSQWGLRALGQSSFRGAWAATVAWYSGRARPSASPRPTLLPTAVLLGPKLSPTEDSPSTHNCDTWSSTEQNHWNKWKTVGCNFPQRNSHVPSKAESNSYFCPKNRHADEVFSLV